jgi:hypothetical protein
MKAGGYRKSTPRRDRKNFMDGRSKRKITRQVRDDRKLVLEICGC